MKRGFTILGIALAAFLFTDNKAHTNATGAPAGKTGSPGDGGVSCNTAYCHSGPQATDEHIEINYFELDSGGVYTITVVSKSETPFQYQKVGFQACVEDENGEKIGTLETISNTRTKLVGQNYITHKTAGTETTGSHHAWTFNWIPPEGFVGEATVYAASMFTNESGTSSGDIHVLGNYTINVFDVVDIEETDILDFSIYPNPTSEVLNLKFNNDFSENIKVSLVDVKGMETLLYNGCLDSNQNRFIVPHHLVNGVYIFKLYSDKGISTRQILLNR